MPSAFLDSLPDELLARVVSFLDVPDLAACTLVCQRLRRLARDPLLAPARRAASARYLDHTGAATFSRPSPRTLADQHILLSPARLAPLADPARTALLQSLQRRLHRETLARLLAKRPSREELLQRNVLPKSAKMLDCGPITARSVMSLERERLANTLEAFLDAHRLKSSPRRQAARIVIVYSKPSPHNNTTSGQSPQEECLLLKQPVSTLVHMFACTAMWLTGPPPPPPPPLPGSPAQRSGLPRAKHVRVPQMCSYFEQASLIDKQTGRGDLDIPEAPGRVAMLRQLFT